MLNVLIVDDDIITRTNLKALIEWEKYGFEIRGEATNGQDAINVLEDGTINIVITDISMPMMDGIALIEYLEQKHHDIKVIALSGYDDFDYVRQSMKKGAIDYILKHRLEPEILLTALNAATASIMKERQELDQKRNNEEHLMQGRAYLRQKFLNELLYGTINEKSMIESNIHSLNLELDMKNLAVILSEIDDYSFIEERFSIKENAALLQSFTDIVGEILKDTCKAAITHIGKGRFAIILSFGSMRSDLNIYTQMVTIIDRIKISIKRYLNITASFSISRVCEDITQLHEYYNDADRSLVNKFFCGKDKILTSNEGKNEKEVFLALEIKDERKLVSDLKSLDRQKVRENIEDIFNRIVNLGAGYKSVQMICANLINIVNQVAREVGIEISTVYSSKEMPYANLQKYETILDIKKWMLDTYDSLISILESLNINENYSEYTKKTIEYINKNYCQDIALNDAAEYIGISVSYLSRVFKADCGKGFVEYLNAVRIDKAKVLIENGQDKLKNIVKQVGFNNYNYFFKVFKDVAGMTPLEFEEVYKK